MPINSSTGEKVPRLGLARPERMTPPWDALAGTTSFRFAFCINFSRVHAVSLDDEILARIRAVQIWDKNTKLEDFQLQAAANGSVLVNLKTSRAYLIYDEDSEFLDLQDLRELFPNLVFFPKKL
jgi:hypothetical protein